MSWEDTLVMFAGARMGKTSSIVSTSIMTAPGAVLATSNKGDIVRDTLASRSEKGRVWIFDPKKIYSDAPTEFWFNPLASITSASSARRVAGYFAAASKNPGDRSDGYFDGSAQDVLASMLLAAALAGGDVMHAREWLGNPDITLPEDILRVCGETASADLVRTNRELNHRQRDGVYGMASRFLNVLADRSWAQTVLPPVRQRLGVRNGELISEPGEQIHNFVEFRPEEFVNSTDTLYALSTSGEDSPAALTTVLVGRLFDAGQEQARRCPNGRLATPFVAVLDEAANIVKLRELPSLYSYLGSQGIIPLTFLQSPAQGEATWGREGISMLVSTANIHVYGGNVDDKNYLEQLSAIIGRHEVRRDSLSTSSSGTSRSRQWNRETIFEVADLKELPVEREIILAAGRKPVLAQKVFANQLRAARKKADS